MYFRPLPMLCILISAKGVERWMTLPNRDKNPSGLSDAEKCISTLLPGLLLRLDKVEKELVHYCALFEADWSLPDCTKQAFKQ